MSGGSQLLFTSNGNNALAGPVTVSGNLDRSGNSGYLNITGGLTLNGVLTIRGNDTVDFTGTQTFSAGVIDFLADNSAGHSLRVAGPDGSTLTVAANASITGGSASLTSSLSSTGTGTQALLNLGAIYSDNANAGLQILTDSFTNQGTIGAGGGGVLRIDLPGNPATWANEGTIELAPGGKVEVVDNLVLAPTSDVRLFAAGASQHGVLAVTGSATLAGAFTGAYVNGYVPAEGTFFDFLTATGGRTGEFGSASLPTAPSGDKTVLIYENNRVRMLSTDLADLDLNGQTNTQDFILFLNLWAAKDQAADVDGNGIVDTRDFIAYLNLWTDG